MPQEIGTTQERKDAAVEFLTSYHDKYGKFPTGHSLGRFCLDLESIYYVWKSAQDIVDTVAENA